MKSKLLSLLKYLIGWPLTVVAFFYLGKIIWEKLPEITPYLHTLNYSHLITGTVFLIIFYFLRSYLWYRILRNFSYRLSFKESTYLWSLSELKRYIPGNVWSFIGRAVLFHKKGVEKKDVAKGLVIEAELFVIGCTIISLLSLPLFYPSMHPFVILLLVLLVAGGILVFAYHTFAKKLLPSFLLPTFRPGETLILVGISATAILFFGIGNYFIMTAAFITDPRIVWQYVGVFAGAFVAGYLSLVTPAGFGVREGIVVYALTKTAPLSIAAFIALFTRLVLIFAEVLFILCSFLWVKITTRKTKKIEKFIIQRPYESMLAAASILYSFYFSVVSFLRYDNFYTGRFDLGNMVQTVWNTVHGNIFLLTNPNGTEQVSRLAFHADFILVLLAPFYIFWQDPRMLLLIQSVVLAAGSFFIYFIARDLLKNKNIAFVFALAYLINPSVQHTNLYDFHPVTLATTFFLATFYFFLKRRYTLFIVSAILAALCKEQLWLIIALFGILLFFYHRKRLLGVGMFVVCVSMFYFLFWYAIPNALGSQHFALAYLSDFGDSPTQVIKSFIFAPDKLITTINEPERLHFVRQLLSPLGYLSLVFPFLLIFAGPDLLISLLSNNSQLHQIYYQYTATITPFIFLSAIYGVWVLMKLFPRLPKYTFMFYILATSLYAAYSFGPIPGAREPNVHMIIHPLADKEFITSYVHAIPEGLSVAASNNIGSHLSQRKEIFTIPQGIGKADMIVILLDIFGSQKTQLEEKELVAKLQKHPQYTQQLQKGNLFVFVKK